MEMRMKCYVSMPLGRKVRLQTGAEIDYDQIYHDVIRPAVESAGLECLRMADFTGGAFILKSTFAAVISSDVMIADVSIGNPNVMYELGIRHATRRSPTLLLLDKDSRPAYNISYLRHIDYALDKQGAVTGDAAETLRNTIREAVLTSLDAPQNFSPVFELFGDYSVDLPSELVTPGKVAPARAPASKSILPGTADQRRSRSPRVTEDAATSEIDPTRALERVREYRDRSAWDEMIEFADTLPESMQQNRELAQLLALALNRRAGEGDRGRAVQLLQNLIERTGGDGETYGILGRIYKDQYRETRDLSHWEQAFHAYETGFEKEPDNYYPGVNAITLLIERRDRRLRPKIEELLPRVKRALHDKISDGPADYWDIATGLQLTAIGRNWKEAEQYAARIIEEQPASWMMATTVRELETVAETMGKTDQRRLSRLIERIHSAGKL